MRAATSRPARHEREALAVLPGASRSAAATPTTEAIASAVEPGPRAHDRCDTAQTQRIGREGGGDAAADHDDQDHDGVDGEAKRPRGRGRSPAQRLRVHRRVGEREGQDHAQDAVVAALPRAPEVARQHRARTGRKARSTAATSPAGSAPAASIASRPAAQSAVSAIRGRPASARRPVQTGTAVSRKPAIAAATNPKSISCACHRDGASHAGAGQAPLQIAIQASVSAPP